MGSLAFLAKVTIPERRITSVRRQRLLEKMARAGLGSTVTIRAPAGYGKTTLLVDFLAEADGAVCWLSLDEWDRDPAVFLQYLRLGVERGLGGPITTPVGLDPRSALAQVASRIAEHPGEVCLALDDAHWLDGSESLPLLDYLSRRLPANARLFVTSRTGVSLPSLPRLRLEGKGLVITQEDLAFTEAEVREYLAQTGSTEEASQKRASEVASLTQGWPAAVAFLAAVDAASGGGALSPEFGEYLAAEIYERLPSETAEFLLRTSVLDVLEPQACDAVLGSGGSKELILGLARQSVPVIRIGAGAPRFRLHDLFRDFLRAKLCREREAEHIALQERAARWHLSQGRPGDAIWHFAQAERWEDAASVIEREAAETYRLGRWHLLATWLNMLPAEVFLRRAMLRLWRARILVRLGQPLRALRLIGWSIAAVGEEQPAVLAEFETVRAAALRVKGDVAASVVSARRAVDLAVGGNARIEAVTEARKELGLALMAEGSFTEAVHQLRTALEVAEMRGDDEEAAFLSGCLGSALGSLGALNESVVHLERARQRWRDIGNLNELSWVLNNLGMTYWQLGRVDLARQTLGEALQVAKQSDNRRIEGYALVSLADIDRWCGNLDSAQNMYESALPVCEELGEMMLDTLARTGLADVFRRQSETGEAEMIARRALASARGRGSPLEDGLCRMALGRILRQQGKVRDAIAEFDAAVRIFERLGAKKELAEALFYLVDARLPLRQGRSTVISDLERIARLAQEIGHNYFLVRASAEAPRVAEYGTAKRLGGGFYRELLRLSLAVRGRPGERVARAEESAFPVIEVRAFSGCEVRVDGRVVQAIEWESEKGKELFLLLLLRSQPARRDEIVAELWPDAGGRRASSAFHSTVYRVRQALYPECITESDGVYSLNPRGTFWCDVLEFESLLTQADAARDDEFAWRERIRCAVALYRGSFAPEFSGEWADELRMRLRGRFLAALRRLIDSLFTSGEYEESISLLERACAEDPYDEESSRKLMEAHAAVGNIKDALNVYRRFQERVAADLDEEPGPEIIQLYRTLRTRYPNVRST
jgi:ATP/maltotriose-dependent transcriptional regulator MalT/two-component SAPR family response regulator